MPIAYRVIEIHTSEEVRCQGRLLHERIVDHVRDLRIGARCVVYQGSEAVYENGEAVTAKVMALSYNMPLRIEILLPAAEAERILPELESMVCEGLIGARELTVFAHKTRKRLFPAHIRVRDVMTPDPVRAKADDPVDGVVKRLLSARFTGLPVVDEESRPLGVISQGDLIQRAGMPLRLTLLSRKRPESMEDLMAQLAKRTASEIMTAPAVTIGGEEPLTAGVNRMLAKGVKRLPVVDEWGRLTGMLSRYDVFRTITHAAPDWDAVRRNVEVEEGAFVADVVRRDTQTVSPETPVDEVIRTIDADDLRRVAVVDGEGRFLGLISDAGLLQAFSEQTPGILDYLARLLPFGERGDKNAGLFRELRNRTAGEVMETGLITIAEDRPLDEAIARMTEKGLKRLPVVDGGGRFLGLVSRESLLRAGFSGEADGEEDGSSDGANRS
jgi:CBS-domain-containing membrane protein